MEPLEAGRGLAALAVTIYHASLSARDLVGGAPAWSGALQIGVYGVDFFFMLSGFIIYWTVAPRVNDPGWLGRYAYARATRIYLPYLPIGIGMALAFTLFPHLSRGSIGWSWFTTFTLVGDDSALAVAWSLKHEIAFYAVMGLLFATRKVAAGLVVWAAVIVVLALPRSRDALPLASSMSLEFIAGVTVAAIVRAGHLPWLGRALNRPQAKALVGLGAMSYALYLVHSPVLSLTSRGAARFGLGWGAAMTIGILLSVACAYAFHRIWERPVLAYAKHLGRRPVDRGPVGTDDVGRAAYQARPAS